MNYAKAAWKSTYSRARAKFRDGYPFKSFTTLCNGVAVFFTPSFNGPLDIWEGVTVDELNFARRKFYEGLNDASTQPEEYRDKCQIDYIKGHRAVFEDRGFKLP